MADIEKPDASPEGAADTVRANVHAEALQAFDTIAEATQEERALALQDRRFAFIAGAQWEDEWQEQFENSILVEINKTAAGLEKIINDYRANRITVKFRPVAGRGSEQTAETLNGLFRADAYRCKAQQALDNAFEEAVSGGYGAWRVRVEHEDEFDPDNDFMRIATEAIPDADQSVFWDLNAKLYDKSDADFCFVITAMSRQAFEAEYGQDAASWPDGIIKPYYEWYQPDIVKVAEFYKVEVTREKLWVFYNPLTDEEQRFWNSEVEEEEREGLQRLGWKLRETRIRKRRRVHKWIMCGNRILEDCGFIPGDFIPIIPVYGQRRFIDNMERAQGHVRKAKDPQRVYNTQISRLVETSAMSPIERPVFDPEQIDDAIANQWARAHIDRLPFLMARALRDANGNPVHMGPVSKVEPPQIAPATAALVQVTANDIRDLTNSDDGAREVRANVSAEAMDIAATRTDAQNTTYMDNMRQSVQRWGEVYMSMARETYVEGGRRIETMGEEGEEGFAVLNEPHTDERGRFSFRNDLSRERFRVIADVTEATATRRDKTVKTCFAGAQMIGPTNPELAQALMLTAFLNMDGDGIDDLQAFLRRQALEIGLVKPTEEEKRELAEVAQNQQPDPQAQALMAMAAKETALAQKAEADTAKSKADTIRTLADAERIRSETIRTDAEAAQSANQAALGSVMAQPGIIEQMLRQPASAPTAATG